MRRVRTSHHFDISYELEHQIKGTEKERYLADIRNIIDVCTFSYTRQIEMKGLGHAILTGETLIGNVPFAVLLADDLCVGYGESVLGQMVELYKKYRCSIVAIEEIDIAESSKYGIVDGKEIENGVFMISDPELKIYLPIDIQFRIIIQNAPFSLRLIKTIALVV